MPLLEDVVMDPRGTLADDMKYLASSSTWAIRRRIDEETEIIAGLFAVL